MNIRQREVKGVIEAEDVGTSFVVDDSRVVSRGSYVGLHNHALVLPGTGRAVAHGVSNALRAAVRCISHVILAIALVEPRAFLIVLGLRACFYDIAGIDRKSAV